MTENLESPERFNEIRATIQGKAALKIYYENIYAQYRECLARAPKEGIAVEFGSGAGFAKEYIPDLLATDLIPYAGLDRVMDATRTGLPDASVRAAFMMNVLHHMPDPEALFREVARILKPGGRFFIADQYPGFPGKLLYRYLHHEPFDPTAKDWKVSVSSPLAGANGALAWIIFIRDRAKFEKKFPSLRIEAIRFHSPFLYWAAGGLKNWSVVPSFVARGFAKADATLGKILPQTCSFMTIELRRV